MQQVAVVYIYIYIYISQVSVAVLLDNFITASAQMEREARQHETDDLLRESLSRRDVQMDIRIDG